MMFSPLNSPTRFHDRLSPKGSETHALPIAYYTLSGASYLLCLGAGYLARKQSLNGAIFCIGMAGSCFFEASKIQEYVLSRRPLALKLSRQSKKI